MDRRDFLPGLNTIDAYHDKPISIGEFQNSLAPSAVVRLCDMLNLQPNLRVLEIGLGSGYMAACVYKRIIPGKLFTIERLKKLCVLGKHNLTKKFPHALQEKNIRIFWENGLLAWQKFPESTFDRIYFTVAVDLHNFNLEGFIRLLVSEGILVFPAKDGKIYSYTKSKRGKPFLIEEVEEKLFFDEVKSGKQ
jgi:protein-L-isoaspartate(D-aspartate) O-methyltransferase